MSRRRLGRGSGAAWREPVVLLGAGLFGFELVWSALNFFHRVGPPVVVALPPIIAVALSVVAELWAMTTPGIPAATRRFWRSFALVGTFGTLGQVLLLPDLVHQAVPRPGPVSNAAFLISFLIMIAAMFRLPLERRTRRQVLRMVLDATSVLLAAVAFAGYVALSTRTFAPTDLLVPVVVASVALMAVAGLGAAKALLADSRLIDMTGLRLITLGMFVEMAAMFSTWALAEHPNLNGEAIGRTAMAALITAAAVRQRRVGPCRDVDPAAPGRRPFTFLPYLAVGAVDGLLLVNVRSEAPATVMVCLAAVVLTALVILRQVMAFRENAQLLDELARQEQRLRALVQNAADGIMICGTDGTITYASPAIETLTGCSLSALLSDLPKPVHPADLAQVRQLFREVAASPGEVRQVRARVAGDDGEWRWLEATMTNQLDVPGVRGIVFNLSDVTAAEQYHQQLAHQASHDALTDLANRSMFTERLDQALAAGAGMWLVLVDLDDFKNVNDTLGHQAGDALLVEVSERLRRVVRPEDLVARLGGDEFAVLLEDVAGRYLDPIVERIVRTLAEPVDLAGHVVAVSASVGSAAARPGENATGLVRRADLALYEAKASGKGRHVPYGESVDPRGRAPGRLGTELDRALADGEFEVHYQPIVTIPGGELVGVEALLRWRHPRRGLVPPVAFVADAERTGAIVPIGRWAMLAACREVARWHARFPAVAPGMLHVNVAPRQLLQEGWADEVGAALGDSGLPASRLVVEVTESAFTDPGAAGRRLRAVRGLGARIALDDFGTGPAALSILDSCPVDQLKLDRSLLPTHGRNSAAVAVVRIAESFGAQLVAEGVEAPEQVQQLSALGYRLAQGFLFSRPVPAGGFTELLARAAVGGPTAMVFGPAASRVTVT